MSANSRHIGRVSERDISARREMEKKEEKSQLDEKGLVAFDIVMFGIMISPYYKNESIHFRHSFKKCSEYE